MTLNGAMALLRYFTEFTNNVVLKQLLGLTPFQNLLLTVYDHISYTICTIIQRVFGQNNRRQQPRLQTVVAYAHVS